MCPAWRWAWSRTGRTMSAAVELFVERAREASSTFDPQRSGRARGGWADLRVARRHAARDRARGGAGPGARRGPDRRSSRARLELPSPLESCRTRTSPDSAGHARVEPSAARARQSSACFDGSARSAAASRWARRGRVRRRRRSRPTTCSFCSACWLIAHSFRSSSTARSRATGCSRPSASMPPPSSPTAARPTPLRPSTRASSIGRAEAAQPGLAGGDEVRWLELLELDHDNLSDALEWHLQTGRCTAARLASMLWPFWYQRGYYREARRGSSTMLVRAHKLPRGYPCRNV